MPVPPAVPPPRRFSPGLVVQVLLGLVFAWLVAQHWHPHYGFTRLLQMDRGSLETTIPELRSAPIFTYPEGYDGHYYAQLAARPLADDPALVIDNIVYRGRRILLSWIAWAVAGGEPVAAVRTYAWLNLVVWGALAWLVGKLLSGHGWRGTLAWAGFMFSAGVLHSVRLALSDLLALFLMAAALGQLERGRPGGASAALGLAGLARETTLMALVALIPADWRNRRVWLRVAGWGVLAALPLFAWMWHLRLVHGWVQPGLGNLTLPVMGWVERWFEMARDLGGGPDRALVVTALLAHVAFTVQLVFFLVHRQPADRWWRIGAAWGGLLLLLGTAVWEGYPGAAARVLLPLALAFNVLAVRRGAAPAWLVLGNLSVFAGVLALWQVPPDRHELAAGRVAAGSYVVHADEHWYNSEHAKGRTWAWCAEAGELRLETWPRGDWDATVTLSVKGFTPRSLEISQGGRILWTGEVTAQLRDVTVEVKIKRGDTRVAIRSLAPPGREAPPGGRELGFAVYGVRLD